MEKTFWGMLRRKAGLTQEQFATKAGVSVDTVRAWEGGRTSPSLPAAEKAGAVVGMRPVALLVGASVEQAQKSVERGEGTAKVLRRAAKFAGLADAADEEADAQVLVAGGEELLRIAREAASKSDPIEFEDDDRDFRGRSRKKVIHAQRDLVRGSTTRQGVKDWRAMQAEHADPQVDDDPDDGRDTLGRKREKAIWTQRG